MLSSVSLGRSRREQGCFISHATEDQATAAEVCALLEARGVACWIAPNDVATHARWDAPSSMRLDLRAPCC
jgi:hypothetical protein